MLWVMLEGQDAAGMDEGLAKLRLALWLVACIFRR